jgi:hypothetical protein
MMCFIVFSSWLRFELSLSKKWPTSFGQGQWGGRLESLKRGTWPAVSSLMRNNRPAAMIMAMVDW